MSCRVVYTTQARRDAKKLKRFGLKSKAEVLLILLADDPYRMLPTYEKRVGDIAGGYSRRINVQHRLAYQFLDEEQVVKVIRMWTHYE